MNITDSTATENREKRESAHFKEDNNNANNTVKNLAATVLKPGSKSASLPIKLATVSKEISSSNESEKQKSALSEGDSESSDSLESIGLYIKTLSYHPIKKPSDFHGYEKYYDYQNEKYVAAFSYLVNDLRKKFDNFLKKYPDLKGLDDTGKKELRQIAEEKIYVMQVMLETAGITSSKFTKKNSILSLSSSYSSVDTKKWQIEFEEASAYLFQEILVYPHEIFKKSGIEKLKKLITDSKFLKKQKAFKNPFKRKKGEEASLDESSAIIINLNNYKHQLREFTAYLRNIKETCPEAFKNIEKGLETKIGAWEKKQAFNEIGCAIVESYFSALREQIVNLENQYIQKYDALHPDKPYNYTKFFPIMCRDFEHRMPSAPTVWKSAEILIIEWERFIGGGCLCIKNGITNEIFTLSSCDEIYDIIGKWYFTDPTIVTHFQEAVFQEAKKLHKNHPLIDKKNPTAFEIMGYNLAFLIDLEKTPNKQEEVFQEIAKYLRQPDKNQNTMNSNKFNITQLAYEINHFARIPAQGNIKTNIASVVALNNTFYGPNNKTITDVKIQLNDVPEYAVREVLVTVYPEKTLFEFTQECTLGKFDRKRLSAQYHLVFDLAAYGKKPATNESRLEYYVIFPKKLSLEETFEVDKYYRQLVNLLERSEYPKTLIEGKETTVKINIKEEEDSEEFLK